MENKKYVKLKEIGGFNGVLTIGRVYEVIRVVFLNSTDKKRYRLEDDEGTIRLFFSWRFTESSLEEFLAQEIRKEYELPK